MLKWKRFIWLNATFCLLMKKVCSLYFNPLKILPYIILHFMAQTSSRALSAGRVFKCWRQTHLDCLINSVCRHAPTAALRNRVWQRRQEVALGLSPASCASMWPKRVTKQNSYCKTTSPRGSEYSRTSQSCSCAVLYREWWRCKLCANYPGRNRDVNQSQDKRLIMSRSSHNSVSLCIHIPVH